VKLQSFRGHEFRAVDGITHPLYSQHTFEIEEHDFRDRYWNVATGDVVIDVGASYGSYTLTALAVGASRVLAFEPEETVRADLMRNLTANGWHDRASVMGCGLWDSADEVHMHSYAPHWPAGTISGPFLMRTLDSICPDVSRVDWLKIDVEGAEARVLRGAQSLLERCKPRVIVECHVFSDPTLVAQCRELLPGYKLEEVSRGECVMLVGTP
jgi:FkbM family methyltransferase